MTKFLNSFDVPVNNLDKQSNLNDWMMEYQEYEGCLNDINYIDMAEKDYPLLNPFLGPVEVELSEYNKSNP